VQHLRSRFTTTILNIIAVQINQDSTMLLIKNSNLFKTTHKNMKITHLNVDNT